MKPIVRLLMLTFIGSFVVICLERALYFYTEDVLQFSRTANLGLALAFGVSYIAGSLSSHRLAHRLGEKYLLGTLLGLQAGLHLALTVLAGGIARGNISVNLACGILIALDVLAGILFGMQWPIIESYIAAGRSGRNAQRVVGMFNLSWSTAVPLSLLVAGPLIRWHAPALFGLQVIGNLLCLLLIWPLAARPVHLASDSPQRPPADELGRLRTLLHSSQFLMVGSYATMFFLAPLMPAIFGQRLGFDVTWATGLSGLLDAIRIAAFALLGIYVSWHGKRWPILLSAGMLPTGFFLALYGTTTPVVLVGEILFGLAMGIIYYGALYYALVVKNAAVDAGGTHEGLIGSGFAIGPAAGLLGLYLAPHVGGEILGTLLAIGPLLGLCILMSLRTLRHIRHIPPADPR